MLMFTAGVMSLAVVVIGLGWLVVSKPGRERGMSREGQDTWCHEHHRFDFCDKRTFTSKPFVAFGRGFSGQYETEEEARSVVELNRSGAVYKRIGEWR